MKNLDPVCPKMEEKGKWVAKEFFKPKCIKPRVF